MVPIDKAVISAVNEPESHHLVIRHTFNDGLFFIAIEGLTDEHQEQLEIILTRKEVARLKDYFDLIFSLISKDAEAMKHKEIISELQCS